MAYTIKQGDLLPSVAATLTDVNGDPVDLTDASVVFVWRIDSGDLNDTQSGAAVIVSALAGTVRYDWAAGETDVPGTYYGEWEVTYDAGGVQTFPSKGYNTFEITRDLHY